MDLHDYLGALRNRLRLIMAAVVACAAASLAVSYIQKPVYAAHTKLFVSAQQPAGSDGAGSNPYQLGLLSQQRVTSYAGLVSGPKVAEGVIGDLQLDMRPSDLRAKIGASAPLNTVIINVTVRDGSPQRAQAIANSVAVQFAALVAELEKPATGGPPLVKISVVEPAAVPDAPVTPRKKLNLALGLLAGSVLGVSAAILRETLDTTVKSQDDLAAVIDTPVLGRIGYDSNAPRRPLIIQDDPHSQRAEAFRQLRTNLQFVDIDKAPKSIVVTSSVPSEGKSTSCANLAISLAQAGLKVILVEADLRRPQISDYMGIESAVGLTSVLIGRADLADAIQPWGGDGRLFVLPCGPIPPNPAELLGSQGMADLLKRLEAASDIVLIDTPPLLPVTDAAVLATLTDGAILIVRSGKTRREQVKAAGNALAAVGARVLGVVLTMVTARSSDPNSYAYSYEYRYGSRPTSGGVRDVLPEGSRRSRAPQPSRAAAPPQASTERSAPATERSAPSTATATAAAANAESGRKAHFYARPGTSDDARRQ